MSFIQRPHIVVRQSRKKLNLDLWKDLVDNYPSAAIYFWQRKEVVNDIEIVNTIIDKVIENPKIICAIQRYGDSL